MNTLKRTGAALLLVLCAINASAQKYGYADDRFRDNWFIYGAAGVNTPNVNIGHFDSPAGFALDFNAGKWFSPMFGARVGWQGVNFGADKNRFGYNYVHGDIMWDFINTVSGLEDKRIWTLAPYASMGVILNTLDKNLYSKGFGAGLGLYNGFKVAPKVELYVDLRGVFQNERSIGHAAGRMAMFSALFGVQYGIGRTGWDKVKGSIDPERPLNSRFWGDWFVYASGGVHAMTNARAWTGYTSPTAEIGFGKWFSPYAGARLSVQGISFKAPETAARYKYAYVHTDLLWNLSNTICRRKGTHLWTAAPYAHFGLFNAFDDSGRFKTEFATGAGFYSAFTVSSHIDLFADLRASIVYGQVAKKKGGMLVDPSVSVGIAYNFTRRDLLYRRQILKDRKKLEESALIPSDELQNNGFGGNWSIYLAGGANMLSLDFANPSKAGFRPSFDLGIMKKFSPAFAGRLGVQGSSLQHNGTRSPWAYLHGDILWDIRGTAKGYDPERIWSIAPYLSMGVSFVRSNVKFAGGAGILSNWKVSNRLGIFLDVRGIVLRETQFGNAGGYAAEASAMAGLSIEVGKNYWNNKGNGTILNRPGENWFVQTAGGIALVWDSKGNFNGRPGAAMELTIGKWFSPEWGSRLGILYANMFKSNGSKYDCGYLHGDILWNLSTAVAGYNPHRVYSAIPYLHFGVMGSWNQFEDYVGKDFATGIGLLNDFKLDDKMSFILDVRARAMHGRLTGKTSGKAIGGEALFGISYTMGEGGWRPHHKDEDLRGPLSISTNLVSWADLATINIGLEYAFSRHWSADVTTEFNNWKFKGGSLYDRKRSVTVGFRYWPWYAYSGAWLRPFLGSESNSADGLPIKFLNGTADRIGAGFSAGYSLMVSKHMNLDFGLGFWGGLRHGQGEGWGGFIAPKDIRISLMFVL